MNNLNNPLKLTFNGEYKVNKPQDQSGEYIDAAIGEELVGGLQALLAACEIERKLNGGKVNINETAWSNLLQELKEISSRALGS